MIAASALSEHPVAAHAVGEAAGALLDQMPDGLDLLVVFVDSAHTGAIEDISGALNDLLSPELMIGTTTCGVLERTTEVEDRPALALWAAKGVEATPIRLDPGATAPADGWPSTEHAILLADPFSSPVIEVIADAASSAPLLKIHGGLSSGARGPGGNRLLLDRAIFSDGVVGVSLAGVDVRSVVSQGCRPVGSPSTVTNASGNVIRELASQRPMDVLKKIAIDADDTDRELLASGIHVGLVIDESLHEFTRGDFLIRSVLGADADSGAIAIGAEVDVGATLQFQVRDASTASDDLSSLLADEEASAALTFTCNGRGENLFGWSGHDAELVHELTGSRATAGMFCAGEFGPIGTQNHLHGFTASTLLFS